MSLFIILVLFSAAWTDRFISNQFETHDGFIEIAIIGIFEEEEEEVIARVQKGRFPIVYFESPRFIEAISARVRFLLTTDPTPRIVPALCTNQFAGQNALPATCKRENGTSLLVSSRVYRVSFAEPRLTISRCQLYARPSPLLPE